MNHLIPPHVQAAWNSGDKIHAIKALREATGLGLAESKQLLEAAPSDRGPQGTSPGESLPANVRAALDQGKHIEAMGLGLKEAKDRIDAAQPQVSSNSPSLPHGLSPGEVPRSSSRGVVLFVVGVAVAVGLWRYFKAG